MAMPIMAPVARWWVEVAVDVLWVLPLAAVADDEEDEACGD